MQTKAHLFLMIIPFWFLKFLVCGYISWQVLKLSWASLVYESLVSWLIDFFFPSQERFCIECCWCNSRWTTLNFFFNMYDFMFYGYNGNRHGMSTSSKDEITIDLSQDNNWVKAKF